MAKDSAYFVESRDQLQKFKYSVNDIDNCNSSRKWYLYKDKVITLGEGTHT